MVKRGNRRRTSHQEHAPSHAPHTHTIVHSNFVKVLLFLNLLLLIALALIVFFSPSSLFGTEKQGATTTVSLQTQNAYVNVADSFCTWEDDTFRVCTTVQFSGEEEDYVRCDFEGKGLSAETITSTPNTCCQNVGTVEDSYTINAYLFNEHGEIYNEDSTTVACSGKPIEVFVPSPPKTTTYKKTTWFTAQQESGRGEGDGIIVLNFPGDVDSCTFDGTFRLYAGFHDKIDFCEGATGSFSGSASAFEQQVFTDPDQLRWSGATGPLVDPLVKLHNGFSVFFNTCGPAYYKKPRYFVSGMLSGFGTSVLQLDWKYYNEYPRPDADVFINLECVISS